MDGLDVAHAFHPPNDMSWTLKKPMDPMVRSRHIAAVLVGCTLLLVPSCWSGTEEPAAVEEPMATIQVPGSGAEDTLAFPDPAPGEVLQVADSLDPLPASPPDSVDPVPGPEAATDSTSQAIAEVSDRLRALEAENDSLRIAVRTLVQLTGREPGQAQAADSVASDLDDLIQVDRTQVRNWGLRTLVAVIFLAATAILVRMLAWVLEKLAERSAKRRLIFKRMVPIVRILVWAFAAMFVVRVVFSVGGQELLAAGAAVGVAVGFAAQDILKNVFGGLIVLFDQPFQVGDKVSVGGTYGEVVTIGLRSTRIVTPDDNLVTVPNAQVVDGQVANANAGELNCQVVTDLYLPGGVDEGLAKTIAFEAAASSKYVFLNKPIVVLVKDKFEYTFLTHIKVKAYVLDPRYEFLFMSDVTERARRGFRKAGLLPEAKQAAGQEPGSPPHSAGDEDRP